MCRFNDLDLRVTLDLLESKVLLEHLGKKDHLGFQEQPSCMHKSHLDIWDTSALAWKPILCTCI